MMSNTEQLQYGECCCCLEKGDHRELTKQYYLGKRPEIYEVLIKDTFDIVLKYPETTKLICDICIVQLREANHLRLMVESAQQILSERVNRQPEFFNDFKHTEELQYGECCCCLEKGDHREVTKQYYLGKQPEIYEVLFKSTFNIVLKYPETTRFICDICIVELRGANRFRFMVESSQQSLSDRVNLQPEFINVREDQLELELNTESVKCNSDNEMEEADNDVELSECSVEELNYDADISKENSDPSTSSSDKVAITGHRIKILKILPIYINKDSKYKKLAAKCKDKRFLCHFCAYNTAYTSHLKKHLHTHTGEKQFSCGKCHYRASKKEILMQHYLTHTLGEKTFSCDKCQYRASRKDLLNCHIKRTHSEKKPFSCHMCQYKTTQRILLTQHIRIHTGEKPFSCDFCHYKSTHKGNIRQHIIRIHTGEKPFSCDICQYKAPRKVDVAKHLGIHHKF